VAATPVIPLRMAAGPALGKRAGGRRLDTQHGDSQSLAIDATGRTLYADSAGGGVVSLR